MNTADAANELGVSTKTVQRWVKQLQLPASRNELGHYFFTKDDIAILKEVKEQLKTVRLCRMSQSNARKNLPHQEKRNGSNGRAGTPVE